MHWYYPPNHFLVQQQRLSVSRRIIGLLLFNTCSLSTRNIRQYWPVRSHIWFFIWHQSKITLTAFSSNFYYLRCICSTVCQCLSRDHFAQHSTIYHSKYYNLCMPPEIMLYSVIPSSIRRCVQFILHRYRVYCRRYLGLYSYCWVLQSNDWYTAMLNNALSSHATSYVLHTIDFSCSAQCFPVFACINQYQYILEVHSI